MLVDLESTGTGRLNRAPLIGAGCIDAPRDSGSTLRTRGLGVGANVGDFGLVGLSRAYELDFDGERGVGVVEDGPPLRTSPSKRECDSMDIIDTEREPVLPSERDIIDIIDDDGVRPGEAGT